MLVNGMLFEGLGYQYYGPIDGHNLDELTSVLEMSKSVKGPKLIHVVTKKGRGYLPAEKNPAAYHGVGPFDLKTGVKSSSGKVSYSSVFGDTMMELVEDGEPLVAITAAMPDGTGLGNFMKKYPEKFVDVGIAEQHAVTMAAGLAAEGIKPVFTVYSTFLQRAYDQIIHDVCLQNLHVVFAIDRAGLVGNDGETHHGVFDLSFLTHIPNMTVLAPKDGPELNRMLKYAVAEHEGPIAIRYPRGKAIEISGSDNHVSTPEVVKEGHDVTILAVGNMVERALMTSELLNEQGISCGVVNIRQVYPLKKELIGKIMLENASKHIVTLEDNVIESGFGSRVNSWIHEESLNLSVQNLGIPNRFVQHGDVEKLMTSIGLDPNGIAKRIQMKMKIRSHQR